MGGARSNQQLYKVIVYRACIIHAIPCHTLTALRLWNIIKMMCIKPRLVVVSKSEVIIVVLVAVIVVVIVVIVVVLIIDIVVIIIIVEITPPMPGTHLTMRLVVAFWLLLLYDMINPPPIVLSILFQPLDWRR